MKVIILDYGVGNLGSVYKFFKLFDSLNVEIKKDLNSLKVANILIIPGVGSFGYGCKNLRHRMQYPDQLKDFLINGGLLIGICLGAQLFLEKSEENSEENGLGLVKGGSFYIGSNMKYKGRIPRVGWDTIEWPGKREKDQNSFRYCYFVHSYEMKPSNAEKVIFTKDGIVAAYKKNNIWGLQFHPEKSNLCGYNILNSILSTYAEEN